jgi:hypothetical protein
MKKEMFIAIPLLVIAGIIGAFIFRYSFEHGLPPAMPTAQATTPLNSLAVTSLPGTTPLPQPTGVVRLAWFYKPPDPTQMDLVVKNADFYILTHKDETERGELRAKGVTAPIAQYLLSFLINDPGNCDKDPNGNQVAYKAGDFCQISQMHPDWFLLDGNGKRISTSNNSYHMDPGNEGFRAFWLERARELQETYGWDNIFLDNVEASRVKMVGQNGTLAAYPDDESYQKAVEGFLAYIRQNYFEPSNKKIYANIVSVGDDQVWKNYLQYVDGVMVESFATDWSDGYRSRDDWDQQMKLVEEALAEQKTMILVAQGKQEDNDLEKFSFASYLLLADGNAFFRYTNSDSYRELWLYENYAYDLGAPRGERYKYKDGWRRDFTNGYVIVRPKSHKAEIVLNQ